MGHSATGVTLNIIRIGTRGCWGQIEKVGGYVECQKRTGMDVRGEFGVPEDVKAI